MQRNDSRKVERMPSVTGDKGKQMEKKRREGTNHGEEEGSKRGTYENPQSFQVRRSQDML